MTTQQGLRLATGVVVENMGTTVLVMIPGQHDVLTLTRPAADVVNAVVAGQPVSKDLEPEVELLLSSGVLASPMSRRKLLRAGAIGAGAGIAVLTMPSVAAASSPGGGTSGGAGGGSSSGGGGGGGVNSPPPFEINWTTVQGQPGEPNSVTQLRVTGLTGALLAAQDVNITLIEILPGAPSQILSVDAVQQDVGSGALGYVVDLSPALNAIPGEYTVTVKVLPSGPEFSRTIPDD